MQFREFLSISVLSSAEDNLYCPGIKTIALYHKYDAQDLQDISAACLPDGRRGPSRKQWKNFMEYLLNFQIQTTIFVCDYEFLKN